MTRGPNKTKTQQVRFKATPMMRLYLEDIRQTGLYGSTEGEVAERLVSQGIAKLIEQTVIALRKPPSEEH